MRSARPAGVRVLWNQSILRENRSAFVHDGKLYTGEWLKFLCIAQMTLTACRAIINWFDLPGFNRVILLSVWICGGRFRAFGLLRDKDFSRCTSQGTLTAEASKNGGKTELLRD